MKKILTLFLLLMFPILCLGAPPAGFLGPDSYGNLPVVISDSDGDVADINSSGQLHVVLMGTVDATNSTSTPLLADAVFTGTPTDILDYGFIFITVFSNIASATDGLSIEQSSDGTNWDNADNFTVPANVGKTFSIQPASQYFRVVYTNGGSDQSTFRLQTVFKKTSSLSSSHRISDNLSSQDDGTLGISIIKGQNPSGDYVDFSATAGGNFKVSLEELESGISSNTNSQLNVTPFSSDGNEGIKIQDELGVDYGIKHIDNKPRVSSMPYLYDIAEGNIADHEPIRRYGHNDNVGTGLETVYHPSDLKTYLTSAEILQVVSDDVDDDGDPADTGARTVTIEGLDTNYEEITDTITINGTTNVPTNIAFLRISEFYIATAGSSGYNEGTITISNNADTIVLEQIEPIENEAHCACYTVPAGHTAYIVQAMATEASSKGSAFNFWVRTFGGLWRSKRDIVLLDSVIVVPMKAPMKLPEKTDIEIRVSAILAGAIVTAGFEGWIEAN